MNGWGSIFYAPDGDAGGGGSGDASGGSGGGAGDEPIKTPFDDIALDELDPETREKITKGKEAYVATLQRVNKLDTDLTHATSLARRFQADADRSKAEFDKITGKQKGAEEDPLLVQIRNDLTASGYSAADVDKMAPTFVRMFGSLTKHVTGEVGKGLTPLATTVLAQEASSAFEQAQSSDTLGMFNVPEVAQKTWDLVQERIKTGNQTTSAIVANLAKMAFMDYMGEKAAKGEKVDFAPPAATKPATGMNTNFSYPGSGSVRTTVAATIPADGAKTTLNADTQQALAETFAKLSPDIRPKAFPVGSEKAGRSR